MKCQEKDCQVELDIILCEIESANSKFINCLNHTIMNSEEIKEKLINSIPFSQPCECCDSNKTFKINYGGDGILTLCLDHLMNLLYLDLKSGDFKKLYSKHPHQHLLHDDFYTSYGLALQPRSR